MRFARSLSMLPLLAVLAGCGKAAAPVMPAAPAPVTQPAAREAAAIITSHTGRLAPAVAAAQGRTRAVAAGTEAPAASEGPSAAGMPAAAGPDAADAPLAAAIGAPSIMPEAEAGDDPPAIAAYMATEDPPSYNVDDRTPYNVVIAARSAHTATIAWHTEVPTRAIIEYGRAWGFKKNGFTHKFTDDVAKTDHQITLTELRRWTGYVYRVTAVTSLGLKFPEKDRKFRTKFWSWR